MNWSSNQDGYLDTGASLSTNTLSVGVHTITASVTDSGGLQGSTNHTVTVTAASTTVEDIIIDNGDSNTSSTGTWSVSGNSPPYGSNSLYASNTATYRCVILPDNRAIEN